MNIKKTLLDVYRRERSTPFAWGGADCLGLAVECAVALGHAGLRDRRAQLAYASEAEAKRLMATEGCANVGDVAAKLWPEIPVAQACSGDWVHAVADGMDALGVVVGERIMVRTPGGVGLLALSMAVRAFRVMPCS